MSGISSSQAIQKENRKDSETARDEKSGVVTAETDLASIQGNWELTFESNGETNRTVKEIKGNKLWVNARARNSQDLILTSMPCMEIRGLKFKDCWWTSLTMTLACSVGLG